MTCGICRFFDVCIARNTLQACPNDTRSDKDCTMISALAKK